MKFCIAYDGSPEAEGAIQLLRLMFREKEDNLLVFHGYPRSDEEDVQQESQAVAETKCRDLVRRLESCWREASIHVVVEDSWDIKQQVVDACGSHHCDFLVMGSRCRGFVERTLMGSNSTYALNNFEGLGVAISRAPSAHPVSAQPPSTPPVPGHHFLLFLDGSEPANRALQMCCRILQPDDVVDVVSLFECDGTAPPENQAEDVVLDANERLTAQAKASAQAIVDDGVKRLKDIAGGTAADRISGHVFGVPDVKRGIVEHAEARASQDVPMADCTSRTICLMGSRGLGVISRIFRGSCTNYFLHHCNVPLIAIH